MGFFLTAFRKLGRSTLQVPCCYVLLYNSHTWSATLSIVSWKQQPTVHIPRERNLYPPLVWKVWFLKAMQPFRMPGLTTHDSKDLAQRPAMNATSWYVLNTWFALFISLKLIFRVQAVSKSLIKEPHIRGPLTGYRQMRKCVDILGVHVRGIFQDSIVLDILIEALTSQTRCVLRALLVHRSQEQLPAQILAYWLTAPILAHSNSLPLWQH